VFEADYRPDAEVYTPIRAAVLEITWHNKNPVLNLGGGDAEGNRRANIMTLFIIYTVLCAAIIQETDKKPVSWILYALGVFGGYILLR